MEKLQKAEMEVGTRYPGYAWINEYREMFFRPKAVGAHKGRIKKVVEEEDLIISESNKYVIVHFKIEKIKGEHKYFHSLIKVMDRLITIFQKYDF